MNATTTETAGPATAGGDLLDVTAAAAYLGTPVRFTRRLIAERRIPFHKIGRYVRIRRTDLDTYIAQARVEQESGTARRLSSTDWV